MPKVTRKTLYKVIAVSVTAGIIFALSPFILNYFGLKSPLPLDLQIIMGLFIAIFPPGIAHLFRIIWRRAIDRNIPKLLRHIAESGRIGMSIYEALAMSTKYDMGPLTEEIKTAITKASWGYPIKDTLKDLMEEIATPTSRRALSLIAEAAEAGGDVEEMLMTLQRHLSGIQLTIRERQAIMRPYISYGYIAFFVFLSIQIILLLSFFAPIIEIQRSAVELGGAGLFQLAIEEEQLRILFYHISLIEAVISGLVSGKMGEGSVFAGLKHVAILLIATVLTYYVFIFR
jgi:flagellar protein FlaJ